MQYSVKTRVSFCALWIQQAVFLHERLGQPVSLETWYASLNISCTRNIRCGYSFSNGRDYEKPVIQSKSPNILLFCIWKLIWINTQIKIGNFRLKVRVFNFNLVVFISRYCLRARTLKLLIFWGMKIIFGILGDVSNQKGGSDPGIPVDLPV